MIHNLSSAAVTQRLLVLCALAVLVGCSRPIDPVMPAGQAGYDAIAIDPTQVLPERYTLVPGDKIGVRVYGEAELSVQEVVIDNAGIVSLPLIGDVVARDHSATELAGAIEAAYAAEFLRDPEVTVTILSSREQMIAVEGEVEQPGVYPYTHGQTLLNALATARSTTSIAKLDEVMIFRKSGDETLAGRFDLRLIRGGRAPDVPLVPGDVVVVGYSSVKAGYADAVRALPIIGIFRPIN